jgi:hypothetical protein
MLMAAKFAMNARHVVKAVVNAVSAAARAAVNVGRTAVATAVKATLHPATSMPQQPM